MRVVFLTLAIAVATACSDATEPEAKAALVFELVRVGDDDIPADAIVDSDPVLVRSGTLEMTIGGRYEEVLNICGAPCSDRVETGNAVLTTASTPPDIITFKADAGYETEGYLVNGWLNWSDFKYVQVSQ